MSILFNKTYDYIMCSTDTDKIIQIVKISSKEQLLCFISMLEKEERVQSGITFVLTVQMNSISKNICKL